MNVKCITKNCPNENIVYEVTVELINGEKVMCGPCWTPQEKTNEQAWTEKQIIEQYIQHPATPETVKQMLKSSQKI